MGWEKIVQVYRDREPIEPPQIPASSKSRRVRVAWAPPGKDFNDVLREPGGAERIVAIVNAASPIEAPPIPRAERVQDKRAARKRRTDRFSSAQAPARTPLPSADDVSASPTGSPSYRADIVPGAPENGAGAVIHPGAPEATRATRDAEAAPAAVAAATLSAGGNRADFSQMGGLPENAVGPGGAGDKIDDHDVLHPRCARQPLTDLGNAERFVERNKGKFMWCSVIGWLAWDGKHWSRDGAGALVEKAAHATVRAIQDEAAAIAHSDDDFEIAPATKSKEARMWSDAIREWGRTSESAAKLNCIARDSRERPGLSAPYLIVPVIDLDADPMRINVLNGTIVVHKDRAEGDCIEFRAHRPEDLITKICPVEYDRAATSDLYDRFLAEVQPDETMRRFLHQWGGLSLTGDIGEHKMCFWYGKGRNGKSTLLETWAYIAGGYADNTQVETFIDHGKSQSGAQATPQLAKLAGVRMLRTSEPDKGARLNEALIKAITGGDTIDARHLNREFFSFIPQFKLTMFGNYQPRITGTDNGIWERVRLVPWTVTISKERRDHALTSKLRAEAAGIFNRLLDGLRDWIDHGLIEPAAVTAATQKYREDSDPLGRFLNVCVKPAPGKRVQSSEMHKLYNAWAKASGAREWTATGLGRALTERGYVSKQSNVMWWLDIELGKSIGDFVDEGGKPLRLTESDNRQFENDDTVNF
jgi:putative DNA primase/helicase